MIILGLNAFNPDSAAVLVIDGRVVAAVEEERLTRVKHVGGFPARAVKACLEIAGVKIADVEHVAFARRPERNMSGSLLYALAGRSSFSPELRAALEEAAAPVDWYEQVGKALDVDPETLKFKVHAVEHQVAHAASAYYGSPFNEAAVLTVDTIGDYCSTFLAHGRGSEMRPVERVLFPHSLGIFFGMVSQLIGFEAEGDETKTTGLAAFGTDRFLEAMRHVVRPGKKTAFELDLDYFRHNADGEPVRPQESAPRTPRLCSEKAVRLFGAPRRKDEPIGQRERDLAYAGQTVLEERLVDVAARLRRLTGADHLVYAGRLALNCAGNRAIRRAGLYRSVTVEGWPGESGIAIGAALEAAVSLGIPREKLVIANDRSDLGPSFDRERVRKAMAAAGLVCREPADAVGETADALARGEIVGWFSGRMEFGPRALGHRSVLADPRGLDTVGRLRRDLSHPEPYRSFGASVPLESAARFFVDPAPSPYMLDAFEARPGVAKLIPAVVHFDGTTRCHTVVRDANPSYHDLLHAFGERTGIPLLLNTSFNSEEPLVCTPEEAIACARRAKLDRVVIDGLVAEVPRGAAAPAASPRPAHPAGASS